MVLSGTDLPTAFLVLSIAVIAAAVLVFLGMFESFQARSTQLPVLCFWFLIREMLRVKHPKL